MFKTIMILLFTTCSSLEFLLKKIQQPLIILDSKYLAEENLKLFSKPPFKLIALSLNKHSAGNYAGQALVGALCAVGFSSSSL